EKILLHCRTGLSFPLEEELVGIERVIAEKFESRAMPICRPAFQNSIDIAAAVASLSRVIEAGLDLEFLHGIRTRKRRIEQLGIPEIGNADSVQQIVIVIL